MGNAIEYIGTQMLEEEILEALNFARRNPKFSQGKRLVVGFPGRSGGSTFARNEDREIQKKRILYRV